MHHVAPQQFKHLCGPSSAVSKPGLSQSYTIATFPRRTLFWVSSFHFFQASTPAMLQLVSNSWQAAASLRLIWHIFNHRHATRSSKPHYICRIATKHAVRRKYANFYVKQLAMVIHGMLTSAHCIHVSGSSRTTRRTSTRRYLLRSSTVQPRPSGWSANRW